MKKILIAVILTGLLVLTAVPALVMGQGLPGEQQVGECCLIKRDLEKLAGDAAGPKKGDIAGAATTDFCNVAPINFTSPSWAAYCAIDTVYTVTDWIFWIAFVIAAVIIIIGGIMFMTATGDPEKAKKARQVLVYGIIGILIAVLAKLIPAFARFFVGA